MQSFRNLTKQQKTRRIVALIAILIVPVYLLVCAAVWGGQLLSMVGQNNAATEQDAGVARKAALEARGVQVEYAVYDPATVTPDNHKEDVRIYHFPADTRVSNKFVLVCPGGGYTSCALESEGYAVAAHLNSLGYDAFVLRYRVDNHGGNYAAIEDLAAAVRYVGEHATYFDVDAAHYALVGFSAGGNLIGLFGSEDLGYRQYDLPKPECLMMGYPWCNLNVESGNLVKVIFYATLNAGGYRGLIGKDATAEQKRGMRVPTHVTEAYPATYIMHGTTDVVVPASTHSDVLYKTLSTKGVPCRYERAKGVNHGCGIGAHTAAEGWIERAVAFWAETAD
jgi:acetyl esterase/lipase